MLNHHWEAFISWQNKQCNTAERARGFKRDAILLLDFNISCAGDTEWTHLPQKKPSSITGNEVVCLIMLYRVGESQRQGWDISSPVRKPENSHFLFCQVPFSFHSGQGCKTSELWAIYQTPSRHPFQSIIYILL